MKKISIILLLFIIQSNITYSQTKNASDDFISEGNHPISISLQPFFLLNQTIRIDTEIQNKGAKSAFILGLEWNPTTNSYSYNSTDSEDNLNEIRSGMGFSLAYKIKLKELEKITSFYLSPGFVLRNHKLTVDAEDFYTYEENGIEYFDYGNIRNNYDVNSILIYANLGFQKVYSTRILIDTYLGLGYKIATKYDDFIFVKNYTNVINGIGYNGPLVTFGLKLGYQIK